MEKSISSLMAEGLFLALLKEFHISEIQLKFLLLLSRNSEIGSRKNIKYYGDKFGLTFSTLTSFVDVLEDLKLVRRCQSKQDRRVVLLVLTPRGNALVNEFEEKVMSAYEILHDTVVRDFENIWTSYFTQD